MSKQNDWSDPYKTPSTKPASGCRVAFFVLAILSLIGLAGFCCLCGYLLKTSKETTDAKEVVDIGRQVLGISIPPNYIPKRARVGDLLVLTLQLAEFEHPNEQGLVFIMRMHPRLNSIGQNDFIEEIEEQAPSSIWVKSSKTRTITIAERPVKLNIEEGTKDRPDDVWHAANVMFEAAGNHYYILIQMNDQTWDEDAIVKMLEASRLP